MFNWTSKVLAHLNNSPLVDMPLYSRHIMLILSQQVFAVIPLSCVLSGEAANINVIVFGLI
jgi:hypothetical protein